MNDQENQNKRHKFKEQGEVSQTRNQTFSPSSPTYEFSFTISLDQSKIPPSIPTLDLSPADDIFSDGHLLPLSHLPHSPRPSVNSLDNDNFTLPIKEDEKICKNSTSEKFQAFSFFRQKSMKKGLSEAREKEERVKKRRKLSFKMSHVIKRYCVRAIKAFLFFKGKRNSVEIRRKHYSFSGYFSPRKIQEGRERRGIVSAPVSRWTSPRNSGPLVTNGSICSTKSDSTIDELQAAIQAAIAHCKNSISMDEKTES